MQYYKTAIPRAGIVIKSTGRVVKWDSIGNVTGWLATEDPDVIRELDLFISRDSMGVERTTQAEYDGFLAKKKNSGPSPRHWREEMRPPDYAPDTVGSPVIVTQSNPFSTPAAVPAAIEPVEPPKPATPPKPRTGKRTPPSKE